MSEDPKTEKTGAEPEEKPRSFLQAYGPIAFAMGLGAIGGLVAELITLPLPWMLGPMMACLIAATLQLPVKGPVRIRPVMICIIGVMLGSGFSPDMISRIGDWAVSMALLFVYIGVIGLVAYPYFRKLGGYDRVTAYFAAMPGGLNEMMIVGGSMGGDERKIVLSHASRVVLAIFLIPIWFRLVEGLDMGDRAALGVSIAGSDPLDLLILSGCAVVGYPLGKVLRLPASMLVGPMLVSAVAHLTGLTDAPPPTEVLNIAQWIVGTVIGCRFAGVAPREIFRVLGLGLGATLLMLGVTVIFAVLVGYITDLEPKMVVLAFAPGGLAEMALVALAMRADVAYVATHHVIRIMAVVIAAPLFFKMTGMRRKD